MSKTIHYFWFGGKPKSKTIKKCLESWRKFFPYFEIKEWNETNFDVHCCKYVEQAYNAGKWAFVSDYARFKILHEYGGLYFDTDVEVVRPFDDLLGDDAFAGFETPDYVAPGLVLWFKEPHHPIAEAMCDWYEHAEFVDANGNMISHTVCTVFTELLRPLGLECNSHKQTISGLTVYPVDYFNPFDDATGLLHKTENTYSVHWYDKSWYPWNKKLRNKCTRLLHRWFGKDIKQKLKRLFK